MYWVNNFMGNSVIDKYKLVFFFKNMYNEIKEGTVMREQLKQLKNDVIEIPSMSKEFVKKREFFNMKVEEAKEERPVVELFEGALKDSYSKACAFYDWMSLSISIIERYREEHPKYGENSIRNLVKKELLGKDSTLEDREATERMLDLYFLYDGCGFLKVRELENKLNDKIVSISDNANGRVEEAKDRVSNVVINYDLVWEETKLNAEDVLTRTRRKLGHFLLDFDKKDE